MGHLILSTAASHGGASIRQGALLPLFSNHFVASIRGIVARLLHVSILCQSIVRINDPLTLGIISSWSPLFNLDDVMWVHILAWAKMPSISSRERPAVSGKIHHYTTAMMKLNTTKMI